MSSYQATVERLSAMREQTFRQLGDLSENVCGRNLHMYKDPIDFCWPSSPMGKIRLIRRQLTTFVVTDGLSDPWDTELFENPPPWTFDFELSIEVPNSALPDSTESGIFSSWIPALLFAATDGVVADRIDLVGFVYKFNCATLGIRRVDGLELYQGEDGLLRGLIGVPIIGPVGSGITMATHENGTPITLLSLKLLSLDEASWALNGPMENTLKLMDSFLERGDRNLMWVDRPSVLQEPKFTRAQNDWVSRDN